MKPSPRVKYSPHYRNYAEGSIFIDKEGACTITLTGAASMTQAELDEYGRLFADALLAAGYPKKNLAAME